MGVCRLFKARTNVLQEQPMNCLLRFPTGGVETRCFKITHRQDLPIHLQFPEAALKLRTPDQTRRLQLVLRIQVFEENVELVSVVKLYAQPLGRKRRTVFEE